MGKKKLFEQKTGSRQGPCGEEELETGLGAGGQVRGSGGPPPPDPLPDPVKAGIWTPPGPVKQVFGPPPGLCKAGICKESYTNVISIHETVYVAIS